MAEITAAMVKELREKTDAPMMECKKALTEAHGDAVKAEELLRVKLGSKASFFFAEVADLSCLITDKTADPECAGLDITPNSAHQRDVRAALSNSAGFGGHNVSLAVKRFTE